MTNNEELIMIPINNIAVRNDVIRILTRYSDRCLGLLHILKGKNPESIYFKITDEDLTLYSHLCKNRDKKKIIFYTYPLPKTWISKKFGMRGKVILPQWITRTMSSEMSAFISENIDKIPTN